MFPFDNMINVEEEPENSNPDRCDICIKQHCCKCSEVKTGPSKVVAEILKIDAHDQSESDSAGHHQSDVLETFSAKQNWLKCNVCNKTFSIASSLGLHIRTVHDKIKAFPRPHCPYEAAQSGTLENYILSHTGEMNFMCDFCDKKFTLISHLKVHITAVHDKIKSFPRPHCPYEAAQSVHLERHILGIAHTEKNFKCDICNKKYILNSHLKLHIRTVHDKIKAFPCPHCPYKAAQNGTLKTHIQTHTGEKNFKCNICDKKYILNSHLSKHIRTVHDKIKAFPCPHCPYKAAQSGTLKKHIRTHTGEKNFKCNICNKKFTQSAHCKLHIRTVHGKEVVL